VHVVVADALTKPTTSPAAGEAGNVNASEAVATYVVPAVAVVVVLIILVVYPSIVDAPVAVSAVNVPAAVAVSVVNVPDAGVALPIAPGAANVAPFKLDAFKLATLVVEATTNGAVPVARVLVNWPDILNVVNPENAVTVEPSETAVEPIVTELLVNAALGRVTVPEP